MLGCVIDSVHLRDSLNLALEKERNDVLTQQYNEDVLQSNIYYLLIWILGFLVLFLVSVYIYKDIVKKYSNRLDESEKALAKAQMQIGSFQNSEGEYSEEIDALQRQIKNIQRQTNEDLGCGKEIYEAIKSGKKLKMTDNEHLFIKYYSVLHYETYNQWMHEYKHLSDRLITFLILKDMGKTDAEMKWILGISDVAFRATKSRLNRKKRD